MSSAHEVDPWHVITEVTAKLSTVTNLDDSLTILVRAAQTLTDATAIAVLAIPDSKAPATPTRAFALSGNKHPTWHPIAGVTHDAILEVIATRRPVWKRQQPAPALSAGFTDALLRGPWTSLILPVFSRPQLIATFHVDWSRDGTPPNAILPPLTVICTLVANALKHTEVAASSRIHMNLLQALVNVTTALNEQGSEQSIITSLQEMLRLSGASSGAIAVLQTAEATSAITLAARLPQSVVYEPKPPIDQQFLHQLQGRKEIVFLAASGAAVHAEDRLPDGTLAWRRLVVPISYRTQLIAYVDLAVETPWYSPALADALTQLGCQLGCLIAGQRTERSSAEAHRSLAQALFASGSILFTYDRHIGKVLRTEGDSEWLVGVPSAQTVGHSLLDFVHPSVISDVQRRVAERQQGNLAYEQYETILRHADGHPVPVIISSGGLPPEADATASTVVCVATSTQDISRLSRERDEALQALEAAIRATHALTETGAAVMIYTPDGAISDADGATQTLCGVDASDLLGTFIADLFATTGNAAAPSTSASVLLSSTPRQALLYARHTTGHSTAVLATIAPHYHEGQIVSYTALFIGMRAGEAALHEHSEAHELLVTALERLEAAIFFYDLHGSIRNVLGPTEVLLGRRREDLIGKPFAMLTAPEEQELLHHDVEQMQASPTLRVQRYRQVLTASGERKKMLITSAGYRNANGEPERISQIVDVTDWEGLERGQDINLSVLDFALRSTSTILLTADAKGTIIRAQGATSELTGWISKELTGRPIADLFVAAPHDQPMISTASRHAGETHQTILPVRHRHGSTFEALVTRTVRRLSAEHTLNVFSITDITKLHYLEQQQRQTLAQLSFALIATTTILIIYDFDGKILAVAGAVEQFTGSSKADIIGRSILDFIAPADIPRVIEALQRLPFDTNFPRQMEVRVQHINGDTRDAIITTALYTIDGQPAGGMTIVTDITAQRALTHERNRLLTINARNEGALRTGQAVMHQLGSPLATIRTYLSLIEMQESPSPTLAHHLGIIDAQVERCSELLAQFGEIVRYEEVESPAGTQLDLPHSHTILTDPIDSRD